MNIFLSFCRIAVVLSLTGYVFAQPDLSQKIGLTIADTGSKFYCFEHFTLDSIDNNRHYKITVCIPKTETPEKGYPVLYMLDGNAVLPLLNDGLFERLETHLPVIVTIGYDTDLRFDAVSRAFDYTPVLSDGSETKDEQGRKGGGADLFAEFIEAKIKPKAEALVRIDKSQQAVWGHSYGGLFVMNTLFRHSDYFQKYISISPSLWYQNGVLFQYEQPFIAKAEKSKRNIQLLVFHGSEERKAKQNDDSKNPVQQKLLETHRSIPADSWQKVPQRLQSILLVSEYVELQGLRHGQTFAASLEQTLQFCTQTNTFRAASKNKR